MRYHHKVAVLALTHWHEMVCAFQSKNHARDTHIMSVLQLLSEETEMLSHHSEDEVVWEDKAVDDAINFICHSDCGSFRMHPLTVCLDKLAHTALKRSKECKLHLSFRGSYVSCWLKTLGILKLNDAGSLEWHLVIQEA